MRFSLIIPSYNEAEIIVPTLLLLRDVFTEELGKAWEIIVVDNGSTDGSALLVRGIGDERIRIIELDKKGKGRAVRAGYRVAEGAVVGFTDADLPIEPRAITAALTSLEGGDAVVLIGSRFHRASVMPGREWWRIGSSRIFNLLAQSLVGVRVSDTQCPLKLVKRDHMKVFLSTEEDTWFFDLEFIALLERLRVPLVEVPVSWNEHRYFGRRSKLSATRDGARSLAAMLRIRRRLPKQLSLFQETK